MTIEEKLDLFKDSAIAEANHQSSVLLAEYRQTLDKIYQHELHQARCAADEEIIAETDRIRREHNRSLSMAHNTIKRDLGEKHHKAKELLFADVESMLAGHRQTPSYMDMLIKQINDVKAASHNHPVKIYIDPADAPKLKQLEEAAQMTLTISKQSFLGGIRAVIESRNILIDHSFATKLEEEKNNFSI